MRRREFVSLAGGWIVTRPFAAVAQEAGRRVINCCADTTRTVPKLATLSLQAKSINPAI
jgi:hypothetical protein